MVKQAREFWISDKGLLIRLQDLAHNFSFKTYNGALHSYFKEAGFKKFQWVAVVDEKTCTHCLAQNGRVYRAGQFLPKLPNHVGCRCFFDILIEAEE